MKVRATRSLGGVSPSGEFPTLWVSNMGCWRWQGTASHVESGEQIHSSWTGEVTFERLAATGPVIAYRQVAGRVDWEYEERRDDYRHVGSGTTAFLRDIDLGWSFNHVISCPEHCNTELVTAPEGVGAYTRLCPDSFPEQGLSGFMSVHSTGAGTSTRSAVTGRRPKGATRP